MRPGHRGDAPPTATLGWPGVDDDEWPPRENRVRAALWDAERSLERREYLVATSRLADVFGLAGEQEELVRGLHHLGAAGYRAQTGEPIRARRQLERARAPAHAVPGGGAADRPRRPGHRIGRWRAGGTVRR